MSYLDQLNPEQREAVMQTEGPLLVLAGAGTGKTRVLTTRIAHIIEQGLAEPHNILAVTFTNKASKEMQERVTHLADSRGLNIGTFHAIAARMLRPYAHFFELTSSFSIISADDQLKLVKELMVERNIDIKTHLPKVILGIISRWKDMGIIPSKVSQSDVISKDYQIANQIYPKYQARLVQSNVVDFGDLLLYNNELLINHPDVLKIYQQRFKYILIDEYQDTNAVQYIWARMLAGGHNNICCVGDDDQSIYSWRGAEVNNILRFEKDFKAAKIIKLEQNYRSTMPILNAAAGVISNNKQRHGKTLWTDHKAGEKIKIISCWNDKEEARYVVSEISKMLSSKEAAANQIAILVRAGFQTRAFEEALITSAVPYRIIGGLKFYDRMEIRDVLGYIRASVNNEDDLALERVINVPRRGIGDVTIRDIRSYANEHNISMLSSIQKMLEAGLLKNKVSSILLALSSLFEAWHQSSALLTPYDFVKKILNESGYLDALKAEKTEESRSRIENINEMLRAISEFDDIKDFIEHTSLVMDHDTNTDSAGAVSLMTLHGSKGLEFDAVFLPGWEEGVFPHQRTLNEEGTKGLEEERRIAYVGITRAKKKLWITYAESRFMFHEVVRSAPSRFLAEIPDDVSLRSSSTKTNISGNRMFSYGSKAAPINREEKTSDPFRVGARVSHVSFGKGIVIRKSGDNLDIAFDRVGLKTIKQSFVSV